jgi:hypothetical protein
MGIKNCLSECAKFMSIKSVGKATYTKNFEAGLLCVQPVLLHWAGQPLTANDAVREELFLPSDGVRGSGKRVMKSYPLIPRWEADIEILVVDDTVLQTIAPQYGQPEGTTVLEFVLPQAGSIIGLGRFRPRNNGYYGRFSVESFVVQQGVETGELSEAA